MKSRVDPRIQQIMQGEEKRDNKKEEEGQHHEGEVGNGLKFLVATDIHLGHSENHPELGNDSYLAFEEVLEIAHREQVDFMLLGGDLFDEVNPTQKCIFKCLNILKGNIFGDRELSIGVKGIHSNFTNVNFNISLPIFTIHGNHDYPSNDFGKISVCDLLHASNYMNYFGKNMGQCGEQGSTGKSIVLKPLIFNKKGLGGRYLAVYGLGYLKDFKLHKIFMDGQVTFALPPNPHLTTSVFILHQNRYNKKGGVGASFENCIHPDKFPKWLDLVIWGHEHQAIPNANLEAGIRIFQPGSTVITSFIEAEAIKKQCVLLTVGEQKGLKIEPIALQKSYRPMLIRKHSIHELVQKKMSKQGGREGSEDGAEFRERQRRVWSEMDFEGLFEEELSTMIGEERENQMGREYRKPIVRIKIDYTGFEIIRLIRIEEMFKDQVANSNKIFQYSQKRRKTTELAAGRAAIEDKTVLDMIKNCRTARNFTVEGELTQQIMDHFTQQIMKTPLNFFTLDKFKTTMSDYAGSEGKIPISDIKSFYAGELESRIGFMKRDIKDFTKREDLTLRKLQENLSVVIDQNLLSEGKQAEFDADRFQQEIHRYSKAHQQKQAELLSHFNSSLERGGSKSTSVREPSKGSYISVRSAAQEVKKQQTHNRFNFSSQNEEDNVRRSSGQQKRASEVSSEEDCCERAEKTEYLEGYVTSNFKSAEDLVDKGRKKGKKKKNVTFHDLI